MNFKTIEWKKGELILIDQRKLPMEETYLYCRDVDDVATAIRDMAVRGAPAIGVAAAFGLALAARASEATAFAEFLRDLETASDALRATRPTAVNLQWALERIKRRVLQANTQPIALLKKILVQEAEAILAEDIATNRQIGEYGATLIRQGAKVLTHCNAGALATAGHGTALGILYSAKAQGKTFSVFVDETRPFLQGSRLTAWELTQNGIPVTLITDNMAAHFMNRGAIDCVLVGADRIAANGDVANKIGTYNIAILAQAHRIPFYVAAPTSTIDRQTPTGAAIPIEERPVGEVTNFYRQPIAPQGISVRNPAFDVTPHHLVTAIVTEQGILEAPYEQAIKRVTKE